MNFKNSIIFFIKFFFLIFFLYIFFYFICFFNFIFFLNLIFGFLQIILKTTGTFLNFLKGSKLYSKLFLFASQYIQRMSLISENQMNAYVHTSKWSKKFISAKILDIIYIKYSLKSTKFAYCAIILVTSVFDADWALNV